MRAYRPSIDRFVINVRHAGHGALVKLAGAVGVIEPLKGHDDLVVLRLPDGGDEPREAWSRVVHAVGGSLSVEPVMMDETGSPHYPTGRIAVRFKAPPGEGELTTFAERHALRVLSRNKYVPSQVVFEPQDPAACYLPDLVEAVDAEGGVEAAWPETLSEYRRV